MIVTIVLLMIVIVAVIAIQYNVNKRRQKKQVKSTLELISLLKQLVSFSQKHRGMNATLLQGNQNAKSAISDLRQQISRVTTAISQYPAIEQQERWHAYLDHWSRLERNSANLSVQQSFDQHTNLIENCLYLLEDVAEDIRYNQIAGVQYHQIQFLWRELPLTAEYIGQARAVGAASATKGISTQIDKVKLGYLQSKITSLSKIAHRTLMRVQTQSSSAEIDDALEACTSLTTLIQQEFLNVEKVAINTHDYFAAASATMDKINHILENEVEYLLIRTN